MLRRTPRLEIFPDRLAANARAVLQACRRHGARVACVTKVACAHPAVARAFQEAGADMIGDSRLANLQAVAEAGITLPLLLLRGPTPSQVTDVVRTADLSLCSSPAALRLLSRAARFLNRRHQVILMVDLGDLREGLWPDQVVPALRAAARLPGIRVVGLGCNFACFAGVAPTTGALETLVALRDRGRQETGLDLDLLSGGTSACLPLLAAGGVPEAINHFRIGEAIALGTSPLDRTPWPGTRQDTFRLVAEVIEVARKPSAPAGGGGQNAFGERPRFPDRGFRRRAILDLGRQDVVVDGLQPELPGVQVLGGSSDHLLLDVEDAGAEVAPGVELGFLPSYGALLALSTSPYVQKVVVAG